MCFKKSKRHILDCGDLILACTRRNLIWGFSTEFSHSDWRFSWKDDLGFSGMGVMERSWGFEKGKSWKSAGTFVRTLLAAYMRLLGGIFGIAIVEKNLYDYWRRTPTRGRGKEKCLVL